MTAAQISLYWREWAKVAAALKQTSRTAAQIAAERHALHIRALGKDASMKTLTNKQFDLVLAAFRAVHSPGDIAPQLAAIRQPVTRAHYVIKSLCAKLGASLEYAQGVAMKMNAEGKLGSSRLDELDADGLKAVITALTIQVRRESAAK